MLPDQVLAKMLQEGVLAGPYTRPHPVTASIASRAWQRVREFLWRLP
jgi:hypothetical protein